MYVCASEERQLPLAKMVARASTFPFDTVMRYRAGMGSMKIERSITNDSAP